MSQVDFVTQAALVLWQRADTGSPRLGATPNVSLRPCCVVTHCRLPHLIRSFFVAMIVSRITARAKIMHGRRYEIVGRIDESRFTTMEHREAPSVRASEGGRTNLDVRTCL